MGWVVVFQVFACMAFGGPLFFCAVTRLEQRIIVAVVSVLGMTYIVGWTRLHGPHEFVLKCCNWGGVSAALLFFVFGAADLVTGLRAGSVRQSWAGMTWMIGMIMVCVFGARLRQRYRSQSPKSIN